MKHISFLITMLILCGCSVRYRSGDIVYDKATCKPYVVTLGDAPWGVLVMEGKDGQQLQRLPDEVVPQKSLCVEWPKP